MCIVKTIEYKGLKNSLLLTNGTIELVAITQLGPRIIRYGFIDGPNEFLELEDELRNPTDDEWQIFGGHRLWHSPESEARVAAPDCFPISYEIIENGFVLNQPTEPHTGIQKSMVVTMNQDGCVSVMHRLTNKSLWPLQLACWGLSVMASDGLEVVPLPNRDTGFLPNATLTLWPYTKMNDFRVTWGEKYIFLRQSRKAEGKFKFGFPNEHGWAAYFNHNNVFVKRHIHIQNEYYPDTNCSFETFTNELMLEVESLGPLVILQPEETEEHFERWELYRDILPPDSEQDMDKIFEKIGGSYEKS